MNLPEWDISFPEGSGLCVITEDGKEVGVIHAAQGHEIRLYIEQYPEKKQKAILGVLVTLESYQRIKEAD